MTVTVMPPAALPALARSLVPGLRVSADLVCAAGGTTMLPPLPIVDIQPEGERLLFTLPAGLRVPVALDARVTMVCAPTTHPAWCEDPRECERQRDSDGSIYHGSAHRGVDVLHAESGRTETLLVGLSRTDDPDGAQSPTMVHILAMNTTADLDMPPAQARELGRLLLAAADAAEHNTDGW